MAEKACCTQCVENMLMKTISDLEHMTRKDTGPRERNIIVIREQY